MAKKNSKAKTPSVRRYRDVASGRFVTKKHAKKNRQATVKEIAALRVRDAERASAS